MSNFSENGEGREFPRLRGDKQTERLKDIFVGYLGISSDVEISRRSNIFFSSHSVYL